MQILSLNIRHGGGKRITAIVNYVLRQNPEVFVATEYCHGETGRNLTSALSGSGFRYQFFPDSAPGVNSVLIASRLPAEALPLQPAEVDRHRIVACRLGRLALLGVYFAQGKQKETLFDYLLGGNVASLCPALLIGDLNTGLHFIDEGGKTLVCADKFAALERAGWTDLWRRQHGPQAREFTWCSPKAKRGYRLDHAFATQGLSQHVRRCWYDHNTRRDNGASRLTDHSALIVDIDEAALAPAAPEGPAALA